MGVRRLQRALRDGAYAPGPVDGLYGPLTEGAVRRFQQAHGLTSDGVVGPRTRAVLRAASLGQRRAPPIRPGADYRSPGGSARVLELQRMLTRLRYEFGALDGLYGPRTQAAVQWFQVNRGLRPTGIVDQATLWRLRALSRGSPGIDGAAASSELEVPPLPSAGWHGRPIRNPHRYTSPAALDAAGRNDGRARPLRLGAGYRSAVGSQRVRQVQRDLRRLGYRPGPVDGLFGPRTKAAVQWFQMKYGLRASGTVNAVTLRQLRTLTFGRGPAQSARKRAIEPVLPSRAARPPDANEPGSGVGPLLLVLVAAFGVAAVSLLTLMRSGPRRAAPASISPHAGAGGGASPAPAPASFGQRSPCVVGYASAGDQAELERQAAAIERACIERGWTLACVIRESGSSNGNGHKRPGLAHAVKQVRNGLGGRLVVDSLDHLGHSKDEIEAQLGRSAGNGIELVALDTVGSAAPKGRRPRRARR